MFISRCFGICNNYNKLLLVQTVASPNPLFSYFFIFPGSDVCERARVYVCAGMHERICLVVVCHGIHRLFAGNAEGVVFSGAFIWGRFQSLTPLFSLLPPFSLSLPFLARFLLHPLLLLLAVLHRRQRRRRVPRQCRPDR